MSTSAADLDAVARALGVSTDDGIVDAVEALQARVERAGDELLVVFREVQRVSPDAEEALSSAMGHVAGAYLALGRVRAAAGEHVRGDR